MSLFNPPKVAEWQWLDESCGLWYPWYTIGALEEISKWDLFGKAVFEYGGGRSTLWWLSKTRVVGTIDRDYEYVKMIKDSPQFRDSAYRLLYHSTAKEGLEEGRNEYINTIDEMNDDLSIDIVVVDDIFRYECMVKALTLPRPLKLIVDNWQQDFVFRCPAAIDLMKDYEGQFFTQPDHTNHEGNPWTTAIWHLK